LITFFQSEFMKHYNISGIQQIGIGVSDAEKSWAWYRKYLGMDIPIFKDQAKAQLMTQYTGNNIHERYAILAINIQGGGGFEVWQYTDRNPVSASTEIQLGDLGIYAVKIKCKDIQKTYQFFQTSGLDILGEICQNPAGKLHFFVKDPVGNVFELVETEYWFLHNQCLTGGVEGCIIGVADMEQSLDFYQKILGYDTKIYDKTGKFEDFKGITAGKESFRRVLLRHSRPCAGNFSRLLGASVIELVQSQDRIPSKIFENRYWGDLGFIHLCFDISGMRYLAEKCAEVGFPFTVNSADTFDMGSAGGHFSYIEAPEGTLIEFVETHKVPIIKKLGWYFNLKKRTNGKPLPNWMVRALALGRVKAD
jgi:catechol 2,3-dioxygenase-like lactoylglutathione lyase family enzyme